MTYLRTYLTRMAIFLALAIIGAGVLHQQLIEAFLANRSRDDRLGDLAPARFPTATFPGALICSALNLVVCLPGVSRRRLGAPVSETDQAHATAVSGADSGGLTGTHQRRLAAQDGTNLHRAF